eukprot:12715511-Alexandrium_andersonii.AAC.1
MPNRGRAVARAQLERQQHHAVRGVLRAVHDHAGPRSGFPISVVRAADEENIARRGNLRGALHVQAEQGRA